MEYRPNKSKTSEGYTHYIAYSPSCFENPHKYGFFARDINHAKRLAIGGMEDCNGNYTSIALFCDQKEQWFYKLDTISRWEKLK